MPPLNLLFVAEVLIGRRSRHAGAAAGVGQSVRTMLDQQLARGGDQRLAQVTMVKPLLWTKLITQEKIMPQAENRTAKTAPGNRRAARSGLTGFCGTCLLASPWLDC